MDVTRFLRAIEEGDLAANQQLFAAVYDELRRMATQKMGDEPLDHTLQGTALVHEAYLRLVGAGEQQFESRGHFFTAAAEAMRRILIEHGRRRKSLKRGGNRQRLPLQDGDAAERISVEQLLMIDDALDLLEKNDYEAAQVMKLRLFAGLSVQEAAQAIGVSRATAYRQWTYARAWLRSQLRADSDDD